MQLPLDTGVSSFAETAGGGGGVWGIDQSLEPTTYSLQAAVVQVLLANKRYKAHSSASTIVSSVLEVIGLHVKGPDVRLLWSPPPMPSSTTALQQDLLGMT